MTQKIILFLGSLFAGLGVAIGAFGAHGLKKMLEASNRMETFETGVKYQMYHAIALLFIGLLMSKVDSPMLQYAGIAMVAGILIFSGSLYILCLTGVTKWGAVTPIGGLAFIIGWGLVCYTVLNKF
ncbi:MAG: DUF423 domain-containing protein [Cytophagales bacterium]|nr:DUF423 domain-containing protein [Cytophagales bacterium]